MSKQSSLDLRPTTIICANTLIGQQGNQAYYMAVSYSLSHGRTASRFGRPWPSFGSRGYDRRFRMPVAGTEDVMGLDDLRCA